MGLCVGLQLRRVVDRISQRQDREPGPLVAAAVLSGVVQRRDVQARLLRGDRHGAVQDDLEVTHWHFRKQEIAEQNGPGFESQSIEKIIKNANTSIGQVNS